MQLQKDDRELIGYRVAHLSEGIGMLGIVAEPTHSDIERM